MKSLLSISAAFARRGTARPFVSRPASARPVLGALVLGVLALDGTALAFGSSAAAAPLRSQDGASEFGAPVLVNGVRIPDIEIKRFLVYGPGANALNARKLQILMDHEVKLRRESEREAVLEEMPEPDTSSMSEEAAAAAMAAWEQQVANEVERRMQRYFADPAAIEERLAKEKAEFQERFPTLDHEVELERAYTSGRWYREQVAQTMNFDALFFPDHPDTWPALSREAIHAGSPEVNLIEDYAKEYVRRKAYAEEHNERIVPEHEMFLGLLRDYVMGALWSLAEIKTATQGIPPELVMVIDGGDWREEIRTQSVYEEMKPYFTQQHIADAKLFMALIEAARQRMEREGHLMDIEEFRTMVAEMQEQMQNTMFTMEFLALQGHGFPSQEAYNAHSYLLESMRRVWDDKLQLDENGQPGPELAAHLETANAIMGLAKAEVEVLMVSAFDFPNNRWKENGWTEARDRAYALRSEVDKHLARLEADRAAAARATEEGTTHTTPDDLLPFPLWWRNFIDLNSDYWDPPLPAVGKAPPALGLKNHGRFQDEPMTRNDMKRAIGESEYDHFLANDTVVDKAFFVLEPGQVGGPYRGPMGYYIMYLESRTPPTNPLRLSNERHLQMLREDFVRKEFQRYAHECLNEAQVSGL